jgi:uncharacterized delta-60 repeat protein
MKNIGLTIIVLLLCIGQAIAQSEGRLDSIYGVSGKIMIPIISKNPSEYLNVVQTITQSDGKIIAIISTGYINNGSYWSDLFLCRILPEGQIDLTFGINGFQQMQYPASAIVLLPNDKFMLVSNDLDKEVILERHEASGKIDSTFEGIGRIYTGMFLYVSHVTLQPDGKLLILGDNVLVRLDRDGNRDFSFGVDGYIHLQFNSANEYESMQKVCVQADGKIVVGGVAYVNQYKLACLRLQPNGELDLTFGGDGSNSYPISTYYAADMLLDMAGNIMFGCNNINNTSLFLLRVKPNGNADSTFGVNGIRNTNFASGNQQLNDLILQPDGKLLCIGRVNQSFGLLRLDRSGALDNTFNATGKNTTSFGSGFSAAGQTAIFLADGKLLVLGSSISNQPTDTVAMLALSRYVTGVHLGLLEPKVISQVLLYPNPVQSDLVLEYELRAQSDLTFTVYNMLGEFANYSKVYANQAAGKHQQTLTLPIELQPGNYVLVVSDGTNRKTVKFVKR